MGFCEARGIELKEAVEKPNAAPEQPSEGELRVLRAAVATWDANRRSHLSELCKILEPTTGTSSADQWRNRADQFGADVERFGAALGNVTDPTNWAKHLMQMNFVAEAQFANALEKAAVVAATRDYLIGHLETVDKQKADLERAWERIVGDHKTFDAQEKQAIEDIEKLEGQAAYEAKEFLSKLAHELAETVEWVSENVVEKTPEGILNALGAHGHHEVEIAAMAINAWRALRGGFEADVAKFESYFRQESGSVLFLFKDFREDTKEFIDKYGYKVAEAKVEEARRALAEIVSQGGNSSGNRTDAQQFAEAAGILLTGHLNRVKQSWDSFVEKHEKKFFGPIGPDIRKALLDRDVFEEKYKRLTANNLNELAEKWRNDTRTTIETAVSGLDPKVKSLLRDMLIRDLRALDEALSEKPSVKLERIKEIVEEADEEIE
ncbi:MAG TPA: hypothetical protein VGR51_05895 [Thermoplasmata archaeon]|jgi:hypothetical protein|nr:hypothetical protein [Thermoplasmata archaeon]